MERPRTPPTRMPILVAAYLVGQFTRNNAYEATRETCSKFTTMNCTFVSNRAAGMCSSRRQHVQYHVNLGAMRNKAHLHDMDCNAHGIHMPCTAMQRNAMRAQCACTFKLKTHMHMHSQAKPRQSTYEAKTSQSKQV